MLTYLIRRLLLVPPTLLGMTAIVFFVLANAPGGIGASLLSRDATMRPDQRRVREEYLNRRYGLDKPKVVQYLRWLNKVSPIGFASYSEDDPQVKAAAAEAARLPPGPDGKPAKPRIRPGDLNLRRPVLKMPDLGDSFVRGRPVLQLVAEALPVTIMLELLSLPLAYALAIWLGIQQARRRGSTLDYTVSGITLALWSVPSIWVSVLLIGFLANEQYLRIFPTTGLNDLDAATMPFLPRWTEAGFQEGWLLDRLYHLVLPIICLTYSQFAFLSRLARGALLDNLNADFVRTARAKGLSERAVLYRHAFRNSLIPLITVVVHLLPAMVAGAVVVENVFGINGMGKLFVDAAFQRDFELLLSITLVTGVLAVTAYLLADIGYAIADPRVSYE
ncbi:ABC transporter permease [Fontivita pretiosa]|uniref:ABC transporter permease n=1 Tax=Fontivita pretiosa TaxID=2989684 RepID=UPI003D17DAA0